MAYNQACDDFMVSNPGSCISITHIPKIIGKAYFKVATLQTAVNAFQATGIEPFDSNIFTENDFQPSLTTDTQENNQLSAEVIVPQSPPENESSACQHFQTQSTVSQAPSQFIDQIASTSSALPPLPVAIKKSVRKPRKKLPSLLLSGSPVKKALEERKKEQEEIEQKREKRLTKKANKKKGAMKKPRRSLKVSSSSNDASPQSIPYIDTEDDVDLEDLETDQFCIICAEAGKDELWYQCSNCLKWAHAECSGWNRKEASQRPYKCDRCM